MSLSSWAPRTPKGDAAVALMFSGTEEEQDEMCRMENDPGGVGSQPDGVLLA